MKKMVVVKATINNISVLLMWLCCIIVMDLDRVNFDDN